MSYDHRPVFKLSYSIFALIWIDSRFDCFLLSEKCNAIYCFGFLRYKWRRRCISVDLSKSVLHELSYQSFFGTLLLLMIGICVDNLKLLKAVGVVKESRLVLLNLLFNWHSHIMWIEGLKLSHHRHLTHVLLLLRTINKRSIFKQRLVMWILYFLVERFVHTRTHDCSHIIWTVPFVWGIAHIHGLVRVLGDHWPDEVHLSSYSLLANKAIDG